MIGAATTAGRVSVIIPTFNYGHFIADCIRSVIAQGIEDCEIIVVDDGSTDDTASILAQFSSQIRYIHQENRGLSSARNTGIGHATGEFIQFLDSDDLLGKNALRGRLAFLRENPDCSIAVCRNSKFTTMGRRGQPVTKGSWELYQSNLAVHLCRFNIAPPLAFLLRRRVVDEVGDFDVSLSACEDYDYWLRAVAGGFAPKYCAEGKVFYRVHDSSMSANRSNQVRHDAQLHTRLYRNLYVEKTYPIDDQITFSLAFLTGVATTLSRLRNLDDCAPVFEELSERFQDVIKLVNLTLETVSPTDDLATRLYLCWFAYQLQIDPELQNDIAGCDKVEQILTENLRMSRVLQNVFFSLANSAGHRLEAKRLSEVSIAAKFPGIAASVRVG